MKQVSCVAFLTTLLFGCAPTGSNHFDDPVFVKIAQLKDTRSTDSLLVYFSSPEAKYRAEAALSFGSVQDTTASPALGNLLLEDPDTTVRKNAAFALGQTGGIASVNALIAALRDKDEKVVAEVLEALGKTLKRQDLPTLQSFGARSTYSEAGFALALFRAGARGLSDSVSAETESNYLNPKFSEKTRIAAACYFARSQNKGRKIENVLLASSRAEQSALVVMPLVSGLGKIQSDSVLGRLSSILLNATDYRVKINTIRALSRFEAKSTKSLFVSVFKDSSVNVRIAASEIISTIMKTTWPEIIQAARESNNWRVQANLYKAIVKTDSSGKFMPEVKAIYKGAVNNYQKAWLIGVIAMDPEQYEFVFQELMKTNSDVIRTAAAEALVSINYNKKFKASAKIRYAELYKSAIVNGDPAVAGIIGAALADSLLDFRNVYKNISFLYDARKKMTLPKDVESLQPLDNAIAFLERKKPTTLPVNKWNHPIDWKTVSAIPSNQMVVVKTSKGDIKMRLLVDEAPGSVANFYTLAKAGYFDGRFFHRTVPNFVIQTGCNRGDGFGSEDYSVRSEFSHRRYTTGSVGMASAGKDTEGTQWFITHSPTPNLDGRYTIFAIVESGMDVVDRIEVGDKIVSVVID